MCCATKGEICDLLVILMIIGEAILINVNRRLDIRSRLMIVKYHGKTKHIQTPVVSQTGQRGQSMGQGQVQGSQAGTSGTQGRVYVITPQIELGNQSDIQDMFLLSLLGTRVLFDSGMLLVIWYLNDRCTCIVI